METSGVPLSVRESTIVRLMGHGLSNKRIARQLSIAPETVKAHAKRIFWKLEVQTRAQAVHRAWVLGLLAPDQSMGRADEGPSLADQRRMARDPGAA